MTNKRAILLLALGAGILLSACTTSVSDKKDSAMERAGVGLQFTERFANEEAYAVHMFVHRDYVLMDSRRPPNEYLLYDRLKKVVYRISDEEKTIHVMRADPKAAKPALTMVEESGESTLMDQGQSVHYRYKLNDKTCYNTIAVAGLMPDVVSALSEIDAIVSFYQARQGMEKNANDCATAIDTQLPSHKYNHGFIVREWGDNGYQRFLKEFAENVQPASNLDVLPKDYKRIEK